MQGKHLFRIRFLSFSHLLQLFPQVPVNSCLFFPAGGRRDVLPVPERFQGPGIQSQIPGSFQKITEGVRSPLHIKAVEAKILPFRGVFIVGPHPFDQIRHLLRPVNGKTDGSRRFSGGPFSGVDISVYIFAAAEIPLQGKGPDLVFFHHLFKDILFQLLKFPVSVGRFSQGYDLCPFRDLHIFDGAGVCRKLCGIRAFPGAEAPEAGPDQAQSAQDKQDAEKDDQAFLSPFLFLFHGFSCPFRIREICLPCSLLKYLFLLPETFPSTGRRPERR